MPTLVPLLEGIVGSTAYGLAREGSDIDRLGVFSYKAQDFWSTNEHTETIVSKVKPDRTTHEIGKYIKLALKCNPTVLELLWLEDYELLTYWGQRLIDSRDYFLSESYVRSAYGGYAKQQLEKMKRKHENLLGVYGATTIQRVQQELSQAGSSRERLSELFGSTPEGSTSEESGEVQGANKTLTTSGTTGSPASASQANLWSVGGGVREIGRQGSLGLPDLLDKSSTGGGSRSQDGEGSRADLPAVQSGNGSLQGLSGTSDSSGELYHSWWRLKKNARHCFRLLRQGRDLLETGYIEIRLPDPETYWAFDNYSVEDIVKKFAEEDTLFKEAKSILPANPDLWAVRGFLYDVRKDSLNW